eukprot:2305675-Ditylum_brightwellii.AAC.1
MEAAAFNNEAIVESFPFKIAAFLVLTCSTLIQGQQLLAGPSGQHNRSSSSRVRFCLGSRLALDISLSWDGYAPSNGAYLEFAV